MTTATAATGSFETDTPTVRETLPLSLARHAATAPANPRSGSHKFLTPALSAKSAKLCTKIAGKRLALSALCAPSALCEFSAFFALCEFSTPSILFELSVYCALFMPSTSFALSVSCALLVAGFVSLAAPRSKISPGALSSARFAAPVKFSDEISSKTQAEFLCRISSVAAPCLQAVSAQSSLLLPPEWNFFNKTSSASHSQSKILSA